MICCNPDAFNKEEQDINKQIDRNIHSERKKYDREVKILILGSGESGKSTFVKQMKIIHMNGYTDQERRSWLPSIYSNITDGIQTIMEACGDLEIEIRDKEVSSRMNAPEYFKVGKLTHEMVDDIRQMLKDKGVSEALDRRSEYQLGDSTQYFFEHMEEYCRESYVPNDQDILRTRIKTTGVSEIAFDFEKTHFKIVDVGGQRSERRKWIHCFQDVSSIIFCAAMSDYNQRLYEDDLTNRMHESIKLFEEVCTSRWFIETSIIVFLNKHDIFFGKNQKHPINCLFPRLQHGFM